MDIVDAGWLTIYGQRRGKGSTPHAPTATGQGSPYQELNSPAHLPQQGGFR
jgi:hypothetical protein